MVTSNPNTHDSLIQSQLDTLKAKGERKNEDELGLAENSKNFAKFYKKGISKEELALKIMDQRNKADNTDYFQKDEQMQKANSYAKYIVAEKTHEKSVNEQILDITKKINEANGDVKKIAELTKQLEELTKEKNENKEEPVEEGLKDKINKFRNKESLTKEEFAELGKLLDENEKEREKKQKELEENQKTGGKSKDPLMQSLFDKLNEIDTHRIQDEGKKIERIKTNALPRIPLPKFEKPTTENGVTEGSILKIQRLSYKARVRHHRLNRVAKKFNSFGMDSKKGLNYITAMCKKSEGGRPMAKVIRGIRGRLDKKDIMNNPEVFKKKVEDQKKLFIDDITEGVDRSAEKPIIDTIKNRIDYFAQQYYLEFTAKLLGVNTTKKKEEKPPTKESK